MIAKFIKLCKRIEYRIHFHYLIVILFYFFVSFYMISSNFNVLLKNEVDIEYKSYNNIIVKVDNYEIKGKLNKYLTTRHFDNNCYLQNCGLPDGGEYLLREIKFISINKKWFLFQVCVSEKLSCAKNLPDYFISEYKNKLLDEVKKDILFGFLTIFLIVILGLYETKKYRNRELSEKLN